MKQIAKKFTNFSALKDALRKEMYNAVQESTEKSYEDLCENVNHFYDSEEGGYKRTYQLMNAPQAKEISCSGDTAMGEIRIDTDSPNYDPAGRSVQTIYNYGNEGGLLGNPGFWQKTEEDIPKNIEKSFGKHFN